MTTFNKHAIFNILSNTVDHTMQFTKLSKERIVTKGTAESIIASIREQIAEVDEKTIMAVAGVRQALDELRKALVEVDACLESRNFEKASALGYSSVSSEFIFLQRTLGELNGLCLAKDEIVQDVAVKLECAFEDALPHVDAVMESPHPLRKAADNPSRSSLHKPR